MNWQINNATGGLGSTEHPSVSSVGDKGTQSLEKLQFSFKLV